MLFQPTAIWGVGWELLFLIPVLEKTGLEACSRSSRKRMMQTQVCPLQTSEPLTCGNFEYPSPPCVLLAAGSLCIGNSTPGKYYMLNSNVFLFPCLSIK